MKAEQKKKLKYIDTVGVWNLGDAPLPLLQKHAATYYIL